MVVWRDVECSGVRSLGLNGSAGSGGWRRWAVAGKIEGCGDCGKGKGKGKVTLVCRHVDLGSGRLLR